MYIQNTLNIFIVEEIKSYIIKANSTNIFLVLNNEVII